MLGGADNPNGELPSYITGANIMTRLINHSESEVGCWLPEVPSCEAPPYPRVWRKRA